MSDMPRIQNVRVTGPASIRIGWRNGAQSLIDLAGWVGRGNRHLAPLTDPAVFARAGVGAYGGNVTWDGDEGELAIDGYYLSMIAEEQAPFTAKMLRHGNQHWRSQTLTSQTCSASARTPGQIIRAAVKSR